MLAYGLTGELYITDYTNYRIRKINTSGVISTVAGTGILGNTGDGNLATSATIGQAWGIVIDNTGNIYISDGIYPIIRKINPSGIITTIAGNGIAGYIGDNGPSALAQFNTKLNCSAADALGNLYIADHDNHRIRKITYDATEINEIGNTVQNVSIHPNPANNYLTISADTEIRRIMIIDVLGKAVLNDIFDNKKVEMNIANLAVGSYFVRVNGVYKAKFTKK